MAHGFQGREQKVAKLIEKGDLLQIEIQGQVRPLWGEEPRKVVVGPDMYVTSDQYRSGTGMLLQLHQGMNVIGSLDLYATVQTWLQKDLIGGPSGSRELREHLELVEQPLIFDAVPQGDGTAIAVLTFQGSISGTTCQAELVRITLRHFGISHVRTLNPSRDWRFPPPERFYRFGSKLLFEDGETLYRYMADRSIRKVADLPAGAKGLAGGRWLILEDHEEERYRIMSLDLSTFRKRLIFERHTSIIQGPLVISKDSRYIQVPINTGYAPPRGFAVRADSGATVTIRSYLTAFGDYGYRCDSKDRYRKGSLTRPAGDILVYSLRTGKLVQTLKIPDFRR